ncbi:MAG: hypothetical protein AAF658_04625, partial [Myxococcota bacterium]
QTLAELGELGASGGAIAIGARGGPVFRMSSAGMFRGLLAEDGRIFVSVFADEPWHAPGQGISSVRG